MVSLLHIFITGVTCTVDVGDLSSRAVKISNKAAEGMMECGFLHTLHHV